VIRSFRGPSFRLAGSEVRLHVSWAAVLPILAAIVAFSRMPTVFPGLDALAAVAAGLIAASLALVGALVHEMGHILAARARHVPHGPTILYFFGGVDASDRPLSGPGDEGLVAVAGPVASLAAAAVLGALAVAAASLDGQAAAAAREALVVGAGFSLLIGLANLLPGDPLDGGRIVHGLAWRISGDPRRARGTTARVGRSVGLLMVGGGFVVALAGDVTSSIVLILAGWFVRTGAIAAERRATLRDLVGDLTVADAMDPDPPEVATTLTLDTFAPAAVEEGALDAFAVTREGTVVGVLGVRAIRRLRREAWPATRVEDAMTVIGDLGNLSPDGPLWPALEELQRSGRDALPVLRDGSFAGLLTRMSATRTIRERAALAGRSA
jgi:Zn-dependent protease/CBS domain-containing protein